MAKRVAGTWSVISGISRAHDLDFWYQLKVELSESNFKCYIDDTLVIEASDSALVQGRIGLRTKQCSAHFDDVKINGSGGVEEPSTYEVNLRAGATQVFVTYTWMGSSSITMELVSPTTTYHQSDMSMYEKSTSSFDGTTTLLNVKRAGISVSPLTSAEVWILYLEFGEPVEYQISVEVS
jgi:hypothetical protein